MLYLDSENDLALNPTALRARKNQRLSELKRYFRRYYGFITTGDIATALSLRQVIRERETTPAATGATSIIGSRTATNAADVREAAIDARLRSDPRLVPVFEILMDGDNSSTKPILQTSGSVGSVMSELNNLANGNPANISDIARCVKIHYCNEAVSTPGGSNPQARLENNVYFPNLSRAVPVLPEEQSQADFKNRIVALRMDHPLLMSGEKNAELLTVFFNSVPTLEFTRATPVLNIKFFSTRQTIQDQKLSAITLQKFVEGARDIGQPTPSNVSLYAFARSNQIPTGSVNGNRRSAVNFDTYTVTGLELFRMPQSMQNVEGSKQTENHLAPIIDPFRPLASIKSFSVEVRSAYGLQGTRTATLEIVLHDRSRMAEFADFVKPDRFGETFLEVEYGWLHPDTEENVNPYADLLNLTRSVEHFTIITSNFNFDEVGQVNITLNLIGRGTAESTELSIVGEAASGRIQTQIRQIERLSQTINRLGAVVFPNQNGNSENSTHRREVRGLQGLSAAGDATNNLVLSGETLRNLRDLRATLNDRAQNARLRGPSTELQTSIDRLIGPITGRNPTGPGEDRLLASVSQTLNAEIRQILNRINQVSNNSRPTADNYYNDVFLAGIPILAWNYIKTYIGRVREPARGSSENPNTDNQLPSTGNNRSSALPAGLTLENLTGGPTNVFSLGTLITAFVAKPLAALKNSDGTPKFKEVQLYFYNFNNKAGWMSRCNISQFPVQVSYFIREYGRMRMENASRAVNLSVNEFLNFITSKIVDDVMNPAYGINTLYRINNEGQVEAITRNFDSQMRYNMERANISGHPDFVPPQVTFETEALPATRSDPSAASETILKIHIFDKACSPNNAYRELLTLATDNVLGTLSSYPGNTEQREANEQLARTQEGGNQNISDLQQNWRNLHNTVVQEVGPRGLRLIDEVGTGLNGEPVYRFSGGPQRLKEYIMKGMPHIIYGAMGTAIKTAAVGSQSDPALNTINIQRSLNASPVQPNGQQAGGVPLSVYPVELSMTSLGCPILRYGQEIFVDYNTNTSIDNMYFITGLQHKIEAGSFETTIKFTAVDAFGRYRNLITQLDNAAETLARMTSTTGTQQSPATPQTPPRRHRRRSATVRPGSGGSGGTQQSAPPAPAPVSGQP
jgi:hypothetical protein